MHPARFSPDLLQQQEQSNGFPDVTGGGSRGHDSRLGSGLLNEVIAGLLPDGGKVREVQDHRPRKAIA